MASKKTTLDKTAEGSTVKPTASKKSAGQMLRKARLAKGYKVTQVVQKLNISEEYIKAIEHNDFKKLPVEYSYTVGFVRAYAQLLGLDTTEVIGLFKADFLGVEHVSDPNAVLMAITPKPKAGLPFMYIVLAGGALILSMGYFTIKKETKVISGTHVAVTQ